MVRTHTLLAHIPLLFFVLFSAFFCNCIKGKVICVHTSLQFATHPFTSWLTFILFFTKKKFWQLRSLPDTCYGVPPVAPFAAFPGQHQLLPAGELAPLMPLAVMPLPTRSLHPCTGTLVSAVLSAKALLM